MMSRLLCSVLLYSFFFGAEAQTLDDLTFGTPDALEIATWNIEWFPKNGQTTVNYVSEIIENLDLDVYAIQEIDDTTIFKTMVDGLEHYEYIMMNDWFGGLVFVYNSDRIEVLEAFEIYTSSPFWNPLPRSPLVMKFKHLGEVIYAINNHYKCCGDGSIDLGNSNDEENRRLEANVLIEEYISTYLSEDRVVLLGDLNDVISEPAFSNVFTPFLNNPENYMFADMEVALGAIDGWSYPSWPSHIDHILITNELESDFYQPETVVETIDIASHLTGGWSMYDSNISDHRPVVMRIVPSPVGGTDLTPDNHFSNVKLIGIFVMLGRECEYQPNQLLMYRYSNGTVSKRVSASERQPE